MNNVKKSKLLETNLYSILILKLHVVISYKLEKELSFNCAENMRYDKAFRLLRA